METKIFYYSPLPIIFSYIPLTALILIAPIAVISKEGWTIELDVTLKTLFALEIGLAMLIIISLVKYMRRIINRKPALILDEDGIHIPNITTIRWSNIQSFYLRSGKNLTYLKIKVINKDEILSSVKPLLDSLILSVFYEEAHIGTNISFIKADNSELFKLVKQYHHYYTTKT